jgi:hypothetical protein
VRVENYARKNIRDLIVQHLENRGFFHYQGKGGGAAYTLTAEQVQGNLSDASLAKKGFETGPELHYVLLTNPTFMQVDANRKLVRFSTAHFAVCCFDTRTNPAELTFTLRDGRDFRVGESDATVSEQQIGPLAAPQFVVTRLSTADLRRLVHWWSAPWEAPRVSDHIRAFLLKLACQRFFQYCAAQLEGGRELVLLDDDGSEYRVRATGAAHERGGQTFEQGQVLVRDAQGAPRARYEAPRVKLSAVPLPTGRIVVEIRLIRTAEQDVLEYDARDGGFGDPRRKPTLSLDRLRVPQEVLDEVAQYTPAMVVDPAAPLPVVAELASERVSIQNSVRLVQRQIPATINMRLGYTSSALVTVLMGAVLGVMFRGARALAAFALSMVPFCSVLIILVLGQKVTEDEFASAFGPFVTWGGLLLGLAADGLILRVGVRR